MPSVRVPVTCASILTAATASTLINANAVLVEDASTVPHDILTVAARQDGTLECMWADPAEMNVEELPHALYVSIEPDAAAAFSRDLASIEARTPPSEVNTAGDRSEYSCTVEEINFQCTANMLIGNYWVNANLGVQSDELKISQTVANSRIQQVLSQVAEILRAKPDAKPAWVPPGSLSTFCSRTSAAVAASLLGVPTVSRLTVGPAYIGFGALSSTQYATCQWSEVGGPLDEYGRARYFAVSILRGAAWALPGLSSSPPSAPEGGPKYSPVTISGTTDAQMACDTDGCFATFGVGSEYVEVSTSTQDSDKASALMSAIATAIDKD